MNYYTLNDVYSDERISDGIMDYELPEPYNTLLMNQYTIGNNELYKQRLDSISKVAGVLLKEYITNIDLKNSFYKFSKSEVIYMILNLFDKEREMLRTIYETEEDVYPPTTQTVHSMLGFFLDEILTQAGKHIKGKFFDRYLMKIIDRFNDYLYEVIIESSGEEPYRMNNETIYGLYDYKFLYTSHEYAFVAYFISTTMRILYVELINVRKVLYGEEPNPNMIEGIFESISNLLETYLDVMSIGGIVLEQEY